MLFHDLNYYNIYYSLITPITADALSEYFLFINLIYAFMAVHFWRYKGEIAILIT